MGRFHQTGRTCVEILSPSDTEEKLTLPEKLRRFHTMGVSEVITFDVDADIGTRIRAWDLVQGDLVERVVAGERTPCLTLGLWFVVAPYEDERRPSRGRDRAAPGRARPARSLGQRGEGGAQILSFLYLILWGWAAPAPRRRLRSSS